MIEVCPKPQKSSQFIIKTLLLVSLFLIPVFPFILSFAYTEEEIQQQLLEKKNQYESVATKLNKIRAEKDSISTQIGDLSKNLNVTQAQIDKIQSQIDSVNKTLAEINAQLADRKGTLSDKTTIRNKIVRSYSKFFQSSNIEMFLVGSRMGSFAQGYSKHVSLEMLGLISALNNEIGSFEKDKQEGLSLKSDMEGEQKELLSVKNDIASKKNSAQGQFNALDNTENTVERELSNIQAEIDALNAKQQEILNQKDDKSTGSVGDYESPTASVPSAPFSPAFAAFSYGAYTHYNGMSQYGAKGRAEAKQSYTDILKFYYKSGIKPQSGIDNKNISVQGYSSMKLKDYLYGIAEMPTSWPLEALKAQAVAARTYAYKYTGGLSKSICTTQSCQVYNKDKMLKVQKGQYPDWKTAVDKTVDEVLKENVSSQYSSTTGGYINNVGWDGKWTSESYEKKAGSPWFYKAWYTKSYADSSNCGRAHPWLSEKEMADLLNAWVVWRKGSNSDRDHITPVTTSCWGGDPFDLNEMAEKADKYGEKYSKVTNIDVTISNDGYTSKVTLSTDNGTVSIDGATFKTVFNLRAPSYLSIKSRLFDFEKKN